MLQAIIIIYFSIFISILFIFAAETPAFGKKSLCLGVKKSISIKKENHMKRRLFLCAPEEAILVNF